MQDNLTDQNWDKNWYFGLEMIFWDILLIWNLFELRVKLKRKVQDHFLSICESVFGPNESPYIPLISLFRFISMSFIDQSLILSLKISWVKLFVDNQTFSAF